MINDILKHAVVGQPEPTVGMGCTILSYSDRDAASITAVVHERGMTRVYVQEDKAKCVKGSTHDGSAEYEFQRDSNGRQHVFKKSPSGIWQCVVFNPDTKRWNKRDHPGLRIGQRQHYYDPHF